MSTPSKFTDVTRKYFTNRPWAVTRPNEGDLGDILAFQRSRNRGVVPSARIKFGGNPADGHTVTLGDQVFEFDNQDPPAAAGGAARIAVRIGANLSASLDNLVKAINGTTDSAVWTPGNGSTSVPAVLADKLAGNDTVRVRFADKRGGTVIPGVAGSTAIAASNATVNCANLNVSGKKLEDQDNAYGKITITAAMITAGSFHVEIPFTPTLIQWQGKDANGVQRAVDEAVTIDGAAIKLVFAGGGSPNWQANDVFEFYAVK